MRSDYSCAMLSGVLMKLFEFNSRTLHGGFPSASDDDRRTVRTYIDGCSTSRVLGAERLNGYIQSLFLCCA